MRGRIARLAARAALGGPRGSPAVPTAPEVQPGGRYVNVRFAIAAVLVIALLPLTGASLQGGFIVDLNTNLTAGAQNQPVKADDSLPYFLRVEVFDAGLDTVHITLRSNLAGSPPTDEIQKITGVFLNITGITLQNDDFTQLSGDANFLGADVDPDGHNLAGDGLFDVQFEFPNSGTDLDLLFEGTDVVVIEATADGLTQDNFLAGSSQLGGQPLFGFTAGARLQGLGENGDGSASIVGNVVPVPPSILMAAAGLVPFAGVAGLRRLRRKASA